MALFEPAYRNTIKNEGGYLNDPKDFGGETYMGVARKKFPNWKGWTLIDFYKRTKGALKTNEFIGGSTGRVIEAYVREFYLGIWNRNRMSDINSQAVANIFYDFIILASNAIRLMQSTLKAMGQNVSVDGVIGPQTITAINNVDAAKLHDAYKKARIEYHRVRVAAGKVAAKFLPGWERRTNQFVSLVKDNKITTIGIATTSLLLIFLFITNTKKSKS